MLDTASPGAPGEAVLAGHATGPAALAVTAPAVLRPNMTIHFTPALWLEDRGLETGESIRIAKYRIAGGLCGYHAPRPATDGDHDMFELFRSSSLRQLLSRQAPALAISLVVAELFYKFGSFALECLGFLATWFVLDAVFALVARAFAGPAADRA